MRSLWQPTQYVLISVPCGEAAVEAAAACACEAAARTWPDETSTTIIHPTVNSVKSRTTERVRHIKFLSPARCIIPEASLLCAQASGVPRRSRGLRPSGPSPASRPARPRVEEQESAPRRAGFALGVSRVQLRTVLDKEPDDVSNLFSAATWRRYLRSDWRRSRPRPARAPL